MPQGRYDRYGLTGNPFRELNADGLENPEIFHVDLEVDTLLRTIKEEALEKENKAIIALSGPNGSGKTERLKVAEQEAKARGALSIYLTIGANPEGTLQSVAKEILKGAKLKGFLQSLSPPKWHRDLSALAKKKGPSPPGDGHGKAIGEALSANAPAFLLINDLHHLEETPEREPVLTALQEVGDTLRAGVLVMFGSYPRFLSDVLRERRALATRVNRVLLLPAMSADEGALMLAKKMLGKRIVEKLDPLYPFDREALEVIVGVAEGNPRSVLALADRALEFALDKKAYRVDGDLARAALIKKAPKDSAPPATPTPMTRKDLLPPTRPSAPLPPVPTASGRK